MTRAPTVRAALAYSLLAELAVLSATGVALHLRYRPPGHTDLRSMPAADADAVRFSDRMQGIHQASAYLLLATAVVAVVLLLAWRPVAPPTRMIGAGALVVVALAAAITGPLLAWDQLALWAVTVGGDIDGYTWLFTDADAYRFTIIDGTEVSLSSLRTRYLAHLTLAATALALAAWSAKRPAANPAPASASASSEAQPS